MSGGAFRPGEWRKEQTSPNFSDTGSLSQGGRLPGASSASSSSTVEDIRGRYDYSSGYVSPRSRASRRRSPSSSRSASASSADTAPPSPALHATRRSAATYTPVQHRPREPILYPSHRYPASSQRSQRRPMVNPGTLSRLSPVNSDRCSVPQAVTGCPTSCHMRDASGVSARYVHTQERGPSKHSRLPQAGHSATAYTGNTNLCRVRQQIDNITGHSAWRRITYPSCLWGLHWPVPQ